MKPVLNRLAVIILLCTVLTSCNKKSTPDPLAVPGFHESVQAFTSGLVSVESPVRIRLSEPVSDSVNYLKALPEKLFSFTPDLKGKAFWIDDQSFEFRPSERMKPATRYRVRIRLGEIIDIEKTKQYFDFEFETRTQAIHLSHEGLQPSGITELKWNQVKGHLTLADIAAEDNIKKIVHATQGKRKLPVRWESSGDALSYDFTIDSILRDEKPDVATIVWDGKPVAAEQKESIKINIPALGDFKVTDARVVQQPEQYVVVSFSDPLRKDQNLSGLIRFSEQDMDLRYVMENNTIRIYPSVRQAGTLEVIIENGVKNILGYRLEQSFRKNITFESLKPAVRLLGRGVILPSSTGLVLPFEAVNLRAVDVSVIKIFENNIPQFLQVNHLDGNYQLKRAGRLVLRKTIPLEPDRPVDRGNWNAYSLDLAKLIEPDPGAIYRIQIGFRKQHSLYHCDDQPEQDETGYIMPEENWEEDLEEEISYWDAAEDYYNDDYGYYYDWEEREDPCSPAYYGARRNLSRNILASDLGIIAKGGNGRSMFFAVTSLLSTEPMANVNLEIYNYQHQLTGTVSTNSQGTAEIKIDSKPFLLIARHGNQRGYLRLDDGSSLSMSAFKVSGNPVQKGLKGYIYGERGVWRPGDSLFLTFILEDENKSLPENHPVRFELKNSRGQLVHRQVKTEGNNGFYAFSVATAPDAPTGYWSAGIEVAGTKFNKTIRVETIKPNRLKINLDFGREILLANDTEAEGKLSLNWLHGAVARNLRAEVRLMLQPVKTVFKNYSGYEFDDPAREFRSEEQVLFDGRVDEAGKAIIHTDIRAEGTAPGMLQASFNTRAFEESGEFSSDRFSIPYSPYSTYVGVKTPVGDRARGMLLTDTTHTVDLVTLDAFGKPVDRSKLEVKIYKVEWRWWWEGNDNNLASYINSPHTQLVLEKNVNTRGGKASINFRIDYPEWGRYLIRVSDPVSGHTTGKIVYIDWPGWAGRARREQPGAASVLAFSTDKESYHTGEEVVVTLPSSGQGRALVSLETGTEVFDVFWVPVKETETMFRFTATPEMAPNIYVNVSLLQPHACSVNDLPIRLYGVLPLEITDPATILHPVIEMPDVLKPEEKFTVKIKEEQGKDMTYTLAIVDEGLLDLTRFPTPDPWAEFYAKEALGVKTWDVYDLVMGAYGGRIEKVFAIGGDGDRAPAAPPARANRFPPVVKFMGPFRLGKNKTATHTLVLPRYVGSVRTMVIAGDAGSYGNAEKTTPVRQPLMVLATLPRVSGPSENITLPVTVFAMEKGIRKVRISVRTNSLFSLSGVKEQEIEFSEPGDRVIYFNLNVSETLGVGKVDVLASSGNEKARYSIEMDIRSPNTPVTLLKEGIADPGETLEMEYRPAGINGTNSGILEVSSIPPVDFGRRLKYLLAYPHGCIEQITSGAFPQLYLGKISDLEEKSLRKAENNVKGALIKMKSFQLSDGSLSYWPGNRQTNDWGTSYAGHFMLEAEAQGYSLPAGLKESWLKYQKKAARQWSPPKSYEGYFNYALYDLAQAYRLYTLALAGQPDLSSMNRLRETQELSAQASWRLAAAYALAGQAEAARSLTATLATRVEDYEGSSYCYGSGTRDMAMILETMVLTGNRSGALGLAKQISEQLSGGRWMSTQTISYSLIAVSKFMDSQPVKDGMKFEYLLEGNDPIRASTLKPLVQIPLEGEKTKTIRIRNTGDNTLFARVLATGIPLAGEEEDITRTVDLQIRYINLNGQPVEVGKLTQGTDFIAEVTIRNLQSYRYLKDLALTQVFASGWEIRNSRFEETPSFKETDNPDYMDIRDDRVYSYFDLGFGKKKTFRISLNAAYLGRFYLPGPSLESMYNPDVQAKRKGCRVEVVPPGN